MNPRKIILVMGPPRSGTSVTARILHEKLGVCMGHNLVQGNPGNPKGFYEDSDYVDAIRRKDLQELGNALYIGHGCEVVGIKSPELAFFNIGLLAPNLIIRTVRPTLYIAQSLERWHRPTPTRNEALEIVENYEKHIDVWCKQFETWPISMFPKRNEEELEEELRSCLQGVMVRIRGS